MIKFTRRKVKHLLVVSLFAIFFSNFSSSLNAYANSNQLYKTEISSPSSNTSINDVDFGPYMAYLLKSIKRNWEPPKGNENKRVVLAFGISKSGALSGPIRLTRSSGNTFADRAAILAVEQSAPFRPLPPEYERNDVDIQFTFDYNAFSKK